MAEDKSSRPQTIQNLPNGDQIVFDKSGFGVVVPGMADEIKEVIKGALEVDPERTLQMAEKVLGKEVVQGVEAQVQFNSIVQKTLKK